MSLGGNNYVTAGNFLWRISPLLKIDLSSYFFGGRTAYLGMIKTISLNLDFIVDGNQSINDIASEFVVRILENNK